MQDCRHAGEEEEQRSEDTRTNTAAKKGPCGAAITSCPESTDCHIALRNKLKRKNYSCFTDRFKLAFTAIKMKLLHEHEVYVIIGDEPNLNTMQSEYVSLFF